MTIEQIRKPVTDEYNQFCEEYRRRTTTNVELLDQVVEYLGQFPGKQLRPLLVLLSAKALKLLPSKKLVLRLKKVPSPPWHPVNWLTMKAYSLVVTA